MKAMLSFFLLFSVLMAFGQTKPEKNKAQLFKGTSEAKFEDAKIYFLYTGKVETLLDSIAVAHRSDFSLLKDNENGKEYRALKVNYPGWVYGNYNVHVQVKDAGDGKTEITIWHTYYNKTFNITGKTLGQIETKMLEFYQGCIDKSL